MPPVKLQVPERYAPSLAEFLRLSPQELAGFLKFIHEEEPNLAVTRLAETIAVRLSMDRGRVNEIIRLLRSLQTAREGLGLSVADLVTELRAAMEASGKEELKPADWTVFEAAIAEVLSSDSALSVSSKAWTIMREHAHVYCYGRVLTDLRPIFKDNIEDAPSTFVAIHTLKLVYHANGVHRDFFVALDRNDVVELAALLERALKKEDSLRSLTSNKDFKILEELP